MSGQWVSVPLKRPTIQFAAGGLLIVAAALLYLFTLDSGLRPDELTGGDLITHQYAQVEARPGNAPGYPLYTMGGWLWFRLGRALLSGAFNPVQILSFYSTLWGLASLLVLYLILLDVVNQGNMRELKLIPLLLTAFYATTFFFWYYSVTTEQYTSAVFQTLLLIWLAFRWDDSPRDSTLLWLAFISGTMLANMVTTLFILPPLLWFILFRPKSPGRSLPAEGGDFRRPAYELYSYLKRPGLILQAVGIALVPQLSYIYIYIRGAQHPEWRGAGDWPTTWAWFTQFITIRQGRDELAPGLSWHSIVTDEFPALMGQELTWLIFWGGLIGLAFLGRRRAAFLYSTLAIYFLFSWGYRFGNWFQVIIPAYPIFVIGFAAGLQRTCEWARPGASQPTSQTSKLIPGLRMKWPSFVILILTGLLIYRFSASFPRANQHNLPADTGLDPGWAIVADNPNSPALIMSTFEERVALEYLGSVWDVEPEIRPVDEVTGLGAVEPNTPWLYTTRRAAMISPELIPEQGAYPQAAGEQLIALSPVPLTQLPPAATRLDLAFGDTVHLNGWEQIKTETNLPPGVTHRLQPANWQIAFYWQTSTRLDTDYTISVRPLMAGQLLMKGETALIQDHQPVWGLYPTSRWRPNELVRDVYALTLPAGVMPDAVRIVVYQTTAAGFENLGEQTINLIE